MMLCSSLRDRIHPWLRDYVKLQSLAVILIYAQIGCALIGSLGALYNGVLLVNLAIALFALVAIESNSQSLGRTYAVLLFCAILLDISWFILFTHEIWSISAETNGTFFIFSVKLTMAMEAIGFVVRLSSSLLWFQIYRPGASIVDTSLPREADSDLRNSFLNPPTPAIARQCSGAEEILGGSIYDPAYYTSSSLTAPTTATAPDVFKSPHAPTLSSAVSITEPVSEPKKPEAQSLSIPSMESTGNSVANGTKSQSQPLVVKSEISNSVTTVNPVSSSGVLSGFSSGTQSSSVSTAPPSFSWPGSSQPQQLSSTPAPFPASVSTPASPFGEKKDNVETQEDEMDEEAPESQSSQTTGLNMGSFGGFGLGSTPNPAAPKTNPFGGPFGNATTTAASSPFNMTVPSGELFRPASFTFQNPQPATGFGGFSTTPSQTPTQSGFGQPSQVNPTQSGFGQPSQVGGGQQALGSVLGSFGQSRQLGASPFGSPGGFGNSNPGSGPLNAPASGGFAAAGSSATGGFAGMASAGRGFAGASSSPTGGFAALASASGGFSGAASGGGGGGGGFGGLGSGTGGFGGFAPPSSGGFAGAAGGGGFGGFGGQAQGQGGGFSAFSGNTGGTGKPSELFTQMRK